MRALGFVLLLMSCISGELSAQQSKLEEGAKAILSRIKGNPSLENLNLAGEQIDSLTRYSDKNSKAHELLRRELIDGMISIPGHAQVFADEIRRQQAEVAHLPVKPIAKRNAYNDNRWGYFRILSNLPSPETVRALGEFLSDEKDYPPLPARLDIHSNCDDAMMALTEIGLRDPADKSSVVLENDWYESAKSRAFNPTTPNPQNLDLLAMKAWRTWWQEVKSGRKTFSFKGQNVEYRFKPDGTWDTFPISNPPDDGVKPVIPESAMPKASEQPQAVQPDNTRNWWPWLSILSVLLAVGVWQCMARRKSIR